MRLSDIRLRSTPRRGIIFFFAHRPQPWAMNKIIFLQSSYVASLRSAQRARRAQGFPYKKNKDIFVVLQAAVGPPPENVA